MQIITNQFQKELKKHGDDSFPFLVSEERLSQYESGSFMWHWHPEIEITYIKKGQMLYKINSHSFHLKTEDILFGNSNSLHAGYMDNMSDCEYMAITFDPKLIYGFYQSSIRTKYVEPVIQNSSLQAIHFDYSQKWHFRCAELIQEIIKSNEKMHPFFEFDIINNLQELWKLIIQNHIVLNQSRHCEKVEYDRIKKIVIYIELNYMHKISLNEIANHVHLCESECSRIFKRYMNIPLFSFLQEYRIERSLEYFNDKNYSISEIAGMVGFADSNYYSKVFAKIKGCSPRKYRKEIIKH